MEGGEEAPRSFPAPTVLAASLIPSFSRIASAIFIAGKMRWMGGRCADFSRLLPTDHRHGRHHPPPSHSLTDVIFTSLSGSGIDRA